MRIVCFHLNQVGDLAFALPALKSLRDTYPDAHITSVLRPNLVSLAMETGLVDAVIARRDKTAAQKLKMAFGLVATKADLAVCFSQSADSAFYAFCTGASRRVGFVNTSLGFFLTQKIEFHHPPSSVNNLRLAKCVGAEITSRSYAGLLNVADADVVRTDQMLESLGISESDKLIAVSPATSGRRAIKEWTSEGYAAVARELSARGMKIILLGAVPSPEIVSICPEVIDMGAMTSLGEVAAICKRCEAVIAVDSGVLHIAAAAGSRTVALFGPSDPSKTGPHGDLSVVVKSDVECSPCVSTICNLNRECMMQIRPEEVVRAVDIVLARERP